MGDLGGIIRIKNTSLPKTPAKAGKQYETTVPKKLTIKKWTVTTEKWKTNEMSPLIAPCYFLEEVFGLQEAHSYWLRRYKWDSRDTKAALFFRAQCQSKDFSLEKTRDLQRDSLEFSVQFWSACMWGNYSTLRKNDINRLEGIIAGAHWGSNTMLFPTTGVEWPYNSRGMG